MSRHFTIPSLFLLACIVHQLGHGQPPAFKFKKTEQSIKEVTANLYTPIDTSAFQKPMVFKEALVILHDKLADKKKPVAFFVELQAFADEKRFAGDIFDSVVKLKIGEKELPAANLLGLILDSIAAHDAAFVIVQGRVEITTKAKAKKNKVT